MSFLAIIEHKTSGDEISPGSVFWKRLTLDSQIDAYFIGAASLGYDARQVLYDTLLKPSLQPLKATPVESRKFVKKTGELYANQRLEDETPDEFERRCLVAIAENPDRYYVRGTIVRLESEKREAMMDMWMTAVHIKDARRLSLWPRNADACIQWGRTCAFWPICTNQCTADDPVFFRVADAHEELDEGKNDKALLTQSSLRTFRSCPRRYFFRYEKRLVPLAEKPKPLRVGTSVHAALEVYWRSGGDLRASLVALLSEDPYDRARERAMIIGYAARWGAPPKVVAVEKQFRTPLVNPETQHESRTWELGGVLDCVAELE